MSKWRQKKEWIAKRNGGLLRHWSRRCGRESWMNAQAGGPGEISPECDHFDLRMEDHEVRQTDLALRHRCADATVAHVRAAQVAWWRRAPKERSAMVTRPLNVKLAQWSSGIHFEHPHAPARDRRVLRDPWATRGQESRQTLPWSLALVRPPTLAPRFGCVPRPHPIKRPLVALPEAEVQC